MYNFVHTLFLQPFEFYNNPAMSNTTIIVGKDSPLENTLELVKTTLESLDITLNQTSLINPVPHCWSIHLQAASCSALYSNGKGTSQLASIASGVGEFIERLSTDFYFSEYYLGETSESDSELKYTFYPDELWFKEPTHSNELVDYIHPPTNTPLLTSKLFKYYDLESELQPEDLLDNNTDTPDRGICALPFINTADTSLCYFPISILNNLYVSNGMAAGNSSSECRAQALSEIIERYVKNIVIAKGLSLPIIPDSALRESPHLLDIKNDLEHHDFSVTIHDSSLGGQFPVICVILISNESGGAYAAFGSNCRFDIAIERTLTELLQGRRLDQLNDFTHPTHNIELVVDQYNLENHFINSDGLLAWSMFCDETDFPFSPWLFSGSTMDEEQHLQGLIAENGFTTYLREYLHCGLYCCRIIIPGMSEIYPVDDLIWNNRNKGAQLRPFILQLPTMGNIELIDTLDSFEQLETDDQALVSHLTGVLFDTGSNWDTLRIGELKAHIYLVLKEYELAAQWCDWVVDFGEVPKVRKRTFQLISTICHFKIECEGSESYQKSLRRFYTETEIETALHIADGTQPFFGLQFGKTWSNISTEHSKLLSVYNNLKKAKAELA
jgi:ribosomal protein S12 methylthiotransferase accessory factor